MQKHTGAASVAGIDARRKQAGFFDTSRKSWLSGLIVIGGYRKEVPASAQRARG